MKNIIRVLIASFWSVIMFFSAAMMIAEFIVFLDGYSGVYANELKIIIIQYTVFAFIEILGLTCLMYSSRLFIHFLLKAFPELKDTKYFGISYKGSKTMIYKHKTNDETEALPVINQVRKGNVSAMESADRPD